MSIRKIWRKLVTWGITKRTIKWAVVYAALKWIITAILILYLMSIEKWRGYYGIILTVVAIGLFYFFVVRKKPVKRS